jgi:colanic acid biosynthesis glycosyl transferase WcaI
LLVALVVVMQSYEKTSMRKPAKIVVVSQHYPPDRSTTAAIMSAIAGHLAKEAPLLVLSGTPGSTSAEPVNSGEPTVVEIKNRMPGKAALFKRAMAEVSFTLRTAVALLAKLRRGDVVLTVTAPFMLPYAVAAAARLRRARSILIMHDLYPDVLVMAGVLQPTSIVTKAIHVANSLMFGALNAVVTIGRDTEQRLLRYRRMTREKICFIPNWTTLMPGVRPISAENSYRPSSARFVVGLSGNLGFTHDPAVVFDAARLMRGEEDIHFLLSGWGIGFEQLKQMQAKANLPNITLVERVTDDELEQFLSAADIWLIPYRRNVAGVSVPSRFYNLLALGRPVIIIAEPDAEVAQTIAEHRVGWVVAPDRPDTLAETIRIASRSVDPLMVERAATIAGQFGFARAMASYSALVQKNLRNGR